MNLSIADVLEGISDAFVALDARGRIAHANARACELLGAPADRLVGRALEDGLADLGAPVPEACRRALDEKTAVRTEGVHPRGGRRLDVRIHPSPDGLSVFLTEAAGGNGAAPGPAAPDELRKQAEYFRSLTEYSTDLVAVIEPDGVIRYQNPASIRVIGYPAEEMTGTDAFSLVHPEDLAVVRAAFARILRSPGGNVSLRFRCRHRAGGWRFMEADGRNLLHDENVRGIVLNSRDVTERVTAEERLRESEERYRLVTRATNDVVWDYDLVTDRAFRSAALAETFGVGPEEMEPERDWWERRIHPDDRERVVAGLREALLGDASAWSDEYRFRRGDGSFAIVYDRGLIRRDASGRAVRMVGSLQDLTEKREAEMELRALFAAVQDVIMVLDADGRYLKVAPASPDLLYRPSEELLGRTLHEVLPPDRADQLLGSLRAALESGRTVDLDYSLPMGGEERWFAATVSPMSSETVVWVARDVTVRHRSEEALRASERRYREIFEQSRDAIYVTRPDGTLLDVNPAAEEVFGAPREEILKHSIIDFYADPSQRAAVLERIETEGAIRDAELRLRRLSGGEFDALASATIRREGGESIGMQGTVRDITERKEAERRLMAQEARFRSLIENVHDVIVVLDADGGIRYATPSGTRTLGYSREELRGRTLLDLLHPEDQPMAAEALDRLVREEGAEPITLTARVRARDGSWQVHDAIAQSLLHDPAVRGIVVNSHDVTGQRLLEAQLRQAQKMEAVGRLAGGVAHDFNNVLMAITGFAALLEGEIEPTPDVSLFLTEIHKATDRAASLTRQLLAFGRKQAMRPKVVNLNSVVEGAGAMLRRLIPEDVDLVLRLSSRLGQSRVDPHQVEQVLMNLVVNATDALPEGGTIEIATRNRTVGERERRTHPYLQPGSYVCLSVRDTGHGMDPETLARAFDPFFTTKEQGRGTGLGLSMVYGIIKQSDGYVWAESQPGAGSTFTVLLPRTPDEEDAGIPAVTGPLRTGAGTILLVEDEESVRLLAGLTLRKAGYAVLEARNGEEALRVAREHAGPIDLLLTDVVMPSLGGYALARRLRETRPGLRVIYMTGYAGGSRGDALPDAAEILFKPITPESLSLRVREALE